MILFRYKNIVCRNYINIKFPGLEDITFYAPADIVRELKTRKTNYDVKISPERLKQIIEA